MNTALTLLDSAVRTADISTTVQDNPGSRGVILMLDVTVASGTGGLIPQFRFLNPFTGGQKIVSSIPVPVTTTGTFIYVLYPGADWMDSSVQYVQALPLSAQWSVVVTHRDGSSYTYSLTAWLID